MRYNFLEMAKNFLSKEEFEEESKNFLGDLVNALLGDYVSAGKIIFTISKSPLFVREQLFWTKMSAFLNGVYINDKDRDKLCARLMEQGKKEDNALRLIECIDRAESLKIISYLINATRCLLAGFIDLSIYFRICHLITHTLAEDLNFLKVNILNETEFPYSLQVQGLMASGLMYQSVIDANGDSQYSFTPIAELVDRFAVSYDDVDRYPNPEHLSEFSDVPRLNISALDWQNTERKEIEKALMEL